MKRIEEYELIERYLTHKLSQTELEDFNQRLKNDINWAQMVENHRQMKSLLVDATLLDVKQKLGNIHNQNLKIKAKKQNLYKSFSISLGIGLIISFILFWNFRDDKKAIKNLTTPIDTVANDSSVIDIQNNIQSEKRKNYLQKNKSKENIDSLQSLYLPKEFDHTSEKTTLVDTNLQHNSQIIDTDSQKVKNEMVNKEVIKKSPKEKTILCKLKSEVTVNASCSNENTGSIEFIRSTIKYGTPPYLFSIDTTHFSSSCIFDKLAGGTYYPVIKDAVGCITYIGPKYISVKNCNLEFVFAPSKGERWKIPVPYNKNGTLKIYSRTGTLVFNQKVQYEENNYWDGKNNSNSELPMGAYYFTIECVDGEIVKGLITIVR